MWNGLPIESLSLKSVTQKENINIHLLLSTKFTQMSLLFKIENTIHGYFVLEGVGLVQMYVQGNLNSNWSFMQKVVYENIFMYNGI